MIQAEEKVSRLLMDSKGLKLKKVVKPKTEEGVWTISKWRARGDSNARPLASENVIPVLAYALSVG